MPLKFTDDLIDWTSGVSMRALDTTGKVIRVIVSHEAIDDYGTCHAQEVASDKYDNDRIEPTGVVVVRTSDFLTTRVVGR